MSPNVKKNFFPIIIVWKVWKLIPPFQKKKDEIEKSNITARHEFFTQVAIGRQQWSVTIIVRVPHANQTVGVPNMVILPIYGVKDHSQCQHEMAFENVFSIIDLCLKFLKKVSSDTLTLLKTT